MKIPLISRLLERRYTKDDEKKDSGGLFLGSRSATGIRVSETTALNSSAVYACVRLLSQTVASLPLITYRKLPRGKARASELNIYRLLHDAPNPEMTSFNFREALQGHLCLWGNAFAEIEWDADGYVKALWPLRPDRMKVGREAGKVIYVYSLPGGGTVVLPAYRVLHIAGFGFDGLVGYSPIQLARESIGLTLATEEYGARFFGNGAKPGGVLEHPNKLSQLAQDNLRKSWNDMHSGLDKQHRIAILEEGMKYQQIGIPPEEAQFLGTRQFQISEVARWFGVQPHLIADLDRATFSNIEQQSLEFVIYTMRPIFVGWEQAINQKILTAEMDSDYFCEFLVDGLLRGDIAARYQAYSVGRNWGWLSANDVREFENMNPLPDEQGDIYMVPLNMVPASEIGSVPLLPAPDMTPVAQASLKLLTEERKAKTATARMRTAQSYRGIFEVAGAAIVKREVENVRRAAKKFLTQRAAGDFNAWLDEFYKDFPEFITRQMKAPAKSLADIIAMMAGEEVKSDPDTAKVEAFVGDYIKSFNARYTGSSKGQLQQIVKDAPADVDPMVLVEGRLDEWEQKRPGKVAMNETVQLANAVAKVVFAAAGIRYLRWQSSGSDVCPYCQELDGKVVGIDEDFAGRGEDIAADGKKMVVNRPTSHPPIHLGCNCAIVPD
jgi:HK97 family phage portal protein